MITDNYLTMEHPLLVSDDYFGYDHDEASEVQSFAKSIETVPTVIAVFIGGYAYDIFGRNRVIFWLSFLSGLLLVLFPAISPNKHLYITCSLFYSIMVSPVLLNPLVQDYITDSF